MWGLFILLVTYPVLRVTVPFVHVWTISHKYLNEVLYLFANCFIAWTYIQPFDCGQLKYSFCGWYLFIFATVYADVCISSLLRDWLGVSCLGQTPTGLDSWLNSCGTWIVQWRQLTLGFPSMGQSHINMFPVGYMNVKGFLIIFVFSIWYCLPEHSQGNMA